MAPREPKDCRSMDEVRAEIDRIDQSWSISFASASPMSIALGSSSSRRPRRACRGAFSR